uniref:RNA helicase n=1 Tax=Solanum lycopersicum TaxID=4081 RepID=A0A3Q7GI98_SOLLC
MQKTDDRYVIDSGYVKQRQYNPSTGMYSLEVVQISNSKGFFDDFAVNTTIFTLYEFSHQTVSGYLIDYFVRSAVEKYKTVQAKQRAGRAGRTRPGKCYRLYPSTVYHDDFLDATVPEIQRSSLAGTVLYLKSLDLADMDILKFDFLDSPSVKSLEDALKQLYLVDALDENGSITSLGRKMAELPLEPSLSRTLLEANELDCLSQALTVVSMLSAETTLLPAPRYTIVQNSCMY